MSAAQPDGDSQQPRPRRGWGWVIVAAVIAVVVIGVALYLANALPRKGRADTRARSQLLQLGSALKQYATAHDNELPDQVPSSSSSSALMYRAVTPSGERLKYESFGERVVAWTEPDASGRRLVLLNSLDEVEYVAAAQFDLNEQRRLDAGGGALNRVRKVSIAEEDEKPVAEDPTTAPTTSAAITAPATAPASSDAPR